MSYERIGGDDGFNSGRDFESHGSGSRGPSLKLVLLLLVAVIVLIFFFQNSASVEVQFLWMDVNWPVRSVIVISLVLGGLLGQGGGWFWRRARRRKQRGLDD